MSASETATRLERPVGICPRCGAVARSFDQVRKKCAKPGRAGGKSPGVIRSALATDEWVECPSCLATGRVKGGVCERCNGEGWIYLTPHHAK